MWKVVRHYGKRSWTLSDIDGTYTWKTKEQALAFLNENLNKNRHLYPKWTTFVIVYTEVVQTI